MKLNTFKRPKFTADLYTFTISRDVEGGEIYNYSFERNISLRVVSTVTGRLMVFFKEEDFDAIDRCQIADLRDARGELVRPGGVWQLGGVEPFMNLLGFREGFRGQAAFFGFDSGATQ